MDYYLYHFILFVCYGVSDLATEIFVNSIDFLYYLIIPVIWSGFTVGKKVVGTKMHVQMEQKQELVQH